MAEKKNDIVVIGMVKEVLSSLEDLKGQLKSLTSNDSSQLLCESRKLYVRDGMDGTESIEKVNLPIKPQQREQPQKGKTQVDSNPVGMGGGYERKQGNHSNVPKAQQEAVANVETFPKMKFVVQEIFGQVAFMKIKKVKSFE